MPFVVSALLVSTAVLLHFQQSLASGGHDAPAPAPQSYSVAWVIPGVTKLDGHDHAHETTVELGDGKRLSVTVNDNVQFTWSGVSHNLEETADSAALNGCDFSGSTQLVAETTSANYKLDTSSAKTFHLSCKVEGHCAAKQKLIVEVVAVTPSAASAVFKVGSLATTVFIMVCGFLISTSSVK